jgi:cation:H+ antiporter
METLVLLLVSFVIILLGAELFTNGIEWVGRKLDLAEGAVGSVLAAVGTALPETMIPIVAILAGGAHSSDEVGIGAILGAPFMLATLAMFVTGVAVLAGRGRRRTGATLDIEPVVVGKDVRFFLLTYGLAIAVAFAPVEWTWARPAMAVVLFGLYAIYVRAHFAAEAVTGHGGDLAPLRFHRLDRGAHRADPVVPRLRAVNVQVIFALGLIIVGALVFVEAVTEMSASLGLSATLLALVIAPIATELPEKLNSVLWVRQGKDTLAIGNISGAMVFQACFPTAVALLFAPAGWSVGSESMIAFLSAGIAIVSTVAIFLPMARRSMLTGRGLLIGGAFYVAYLAVVLAGGMGTT